MANEITFNSSLKCTNGTLKDEMTINNSSITQTTKGAVKRQQSIATSDTVITMTGVTAARGFCIKNVDTVNYIDIGPTVSAAIAPMIRLKAGEQVSGFLTPSVVLRGQANTSAVIIEIFLLET